MKWLNLLSGNRFHDLEDSYLRANLDKKCLESAFSRVTELEMDEVLLSWDALVTITSQ
jgi:hypothetical protein